MHRSQTKQPQMQMRVRLARLTPPAGRARLLKPCTPRHGRSMDQPGLLHADASQPNATALVWDELARARAEVLALQRAAPRGPQLAPEVAVFTDAVSPLHWRLQTGEHHSAEDQKEGACPPGHWPCGDPLSWNQNVRGPAGPPRK